MFSIHRMLFLALKKVQIIKFTPPQVLITQQKNSPQQNFLVSIRGYACIYKKSWSSLKAVSNIQYDKDAYILAQAARIVCCSMKDTQNFQGSFAPNFQNDAVSAPLFEIVSMILWGCSDNNTNPAREQAALTIAQLTEFNTTFRSQIKSSSTSNCHLMSRKPPLKYTWEHWLIPKQGAKNVNWSLDVGTSISYNRVLSISTELGNKVIDQLKHGNVVCLQV